MLCVINMLDNRHIDNLSYFQSLKEYFMEGPYYLSSHEKKDLSPYLDVMYKDDLVNLSSHD